MSTSRIHPATVAILCGVVAALHIGKLPPAIPVLREALGLSLLQAGFLLSMAQLAGMLGGVLLGVAADGIGLRRSMLAGLTLLSMASFAGMAASSGQTLLWLRALEGVGVLLVVLPAPSLIRQLVPLAQLAPRLGVWGAYMPAGTAMALLAGPAVMAVLGWPGWWGLLAGLSAAMAVWCLLAVPSDASRRAMASPLTTDTRSTSANAPVVSPVASSATAHAWPQRLHQTLTNRGPWLVAVCFALYSSQWLAVVGFLPSVYGQAGWSAQMAGTMTALVCAINIVGNVAAGRLLRRGVPAQRLLLTGYVCMGVSTVVAFAAWTEALPWLRYVAVLAFSGVGGLLPGTLFSLAVRAAPNERTVSTTVGWVQQCSATGQFVGPPLVAWVAAQAGSWHFTWVVTGAACVAGLAVSQALVRHLNSLPPA